MKKNSIIILLTVILAFASCSFTSNTINGSDKDQLLLQLISYVLEEGHYVEKDFDDQFSSNVFDSYIEILDPYKRYFLESDIKLFEKYRLDIDDQIKNYDLSFFDLTYEILVKRIMESKIFILKFYQNHLITRLMKF